MDKATRSATRLTMESAVRLRSGNHMPLLGFGVYQARSDECRNAVAEALKVGYRHIDSAQGYKNEHLVGSAVAASGIPRTSIFLTTKYMPGHSVPTVEDVYAQLVRSLPRIDPDSPKTTADNKNAREGAYIDLMLIHAPRPNEAARAVHWEALAKAQKEGWIRDIGVSNFGVKHLKALPGPTPAVNQIELHPWCQQKDIVAYCKEHDIVVQAYCPLVRADPKRLEDPVLQAISKRHNKAPTQVLIRWSLQKGYVPLPKSVTPARIKANAEVFDFKLDTEDMRQLDALDENAACSWNPVDHE